jgi:hypothetical protein
MNEDAYAKAMASPEHPPRDVSDVHVEDCAVEDERRMDAETLQRAWSELKVMPRLTVPEALAVATKVLGLDARGLLRYGSEQMMDLCFYLELVQCSKGDDESHAEIASEFNRMLHHIENLPSFKKLIPMNEPQRLNGETERRLDSMALVLMFLNDHGVPVPDEVNKALDDIGVRLLGHFKVHTHWTVEQTNEALTAFSESLIRAKAN